MQSKLDPNLVTIINANLHDIRNGKFNTAEKHADNYLFYVTNGNQARITTEMNSFKQELRKYLHRT
jgi:hypothetical protein